MLARYRSLVPFGLVSLMPLDTRIGDFRFDPATGELAREDSGGLESPHRLPPQPARLLMLLVENHPKLVTTQQIQQTLWPGITTDLDRNLHFCVRQVRSAFGDSASAPKYVETIPRRGYRLIADVGLDPGSVNNETDCPVDPSLDESIIDQPATCPTTDESIHQRESAMVPQAKATTETGSRVLMAGIGLVALLVMVGIGLNSDRLFRSADEESDGKQPATGSVGDKWRIAIMPFVSEDQGHGVLGNGQVATDLLNRLSGEMETLDIVGPLTTGQYLNEEKPLRRIVDQVQPDLLVNGRFVIRENRHEVLVEIIRASDGAHVWVRYFGKQDSIAELVDQVAAELVRRSRQPATR